MLMIGFKQKVDVVEGSKIGSHFLWTAGSEHGLTMSYQYKNNNRMKRLLVVPFLEYLFFQRKALSDKKCKFQRSSQQAASKVDYNNWMLSPRTTAHTK
jgi:hypothetical protein